ncbi:MAG: nitroreductase [Geobacteraceae bacterium]|nr:nitroreductase [Geobacteraceae bacterium]
MEAIKCITTRSSVRKFSADPVEEELVREIVGAAQWSPSYKNSQPWEVVAVSGSRKDELTAMLLDLLDQKAPSAPDMPFPGCWPEPVHSRIKELMAKRSVLAGIDLNAPESVLRSKKANFRFYGAPCGLFLFQDASLGEWSIFDAGIFAQSMMLAAHAKGLATVPQAFLTDYSTEIKKFLGVPQNMRLLLGLSLGYPGGSVDEQPPRPERATLDSIFRFIS